MFLYGAPQKGHVKASSATSGHLEIFWFEGGFNNIVDEEA
jgi:hypothetical protein